MISVLINGVQIGNLSGTGRYTEELVKALLELPEELRIYLSNSKPFITSNDKLQILPFPSNRYLTRLLQPHLLKKLVNQCQPDLIHYPASYGYKVGTIPHITTVHDLAFLENPDWFPPHYRWFYKKKVYDSVQFSKRIITDSNFSAQQLQKHYKISPQQIDVIYLGVSEQFKPSEQKQINIIRNKYKLPNKYILYVGTFEPRKNIPNLIAAWSGIANKIEHDLVLVGRKGWNTDKIEESIQKSNYKDRIHRLGYINNEDLPVIIGSADLFAYISLYEGFGLPPLEAMRCQVPVIASNSGSMLEILGNNAMLVNPEDIQEISEGLYTFCVNTELREKFAYKGFVHAQSFTWKRTAEETLAVYKKCLNEY
ncbi:MAG TPA: glycosyltransferase family 1 protein [Candidatus Hydrogenedens sp.]|nr:glycosyltransferase family 1 protein [Candidatus Hydrogenedens sp.]